MNEEYHKEGEGQRVSRTGVPWMPKKGQVRKVTKKRRYVTANGSAAAGRLK